MARWALHQRFCDWPEFLQPAELCEALLSKPASVNVRSISSRCATMRFGNVFMGIISTRRSVSVKNNTGGTCITFRMIYQSPATYLSSLLMNVTNSPRTSSASRPLSDMYFFVSLLASYNINFDTGRECWEKFSLLAVSIQRINLFINVEARKAGTTSPLTFMGEARVPVSLIRMWNFIVPCTLNVLSDALQISTISP